MSRISSEHNQVPSGSSNRNDIKKIETDNQQLLSIPLSCTNTGSHSLVNLSKRNFIPYADVVKLGKIYFKMWFCIYK